MPRRKPLVIDFDPQALPPVGDDRLRRPPGQLTIPLDLIDPNPEQPRRSIDDEGIAELAASIKRHGVLQPVRVRPSGDRFQLIAGERRWTAARAAGLAEIPTVISEATEDEAFVQALVENVQREDLSAVDRNRALRKVREMLDLPSWEAVAEALGMTSRHLHRLLAVERLSSEIREDPRVVELKERQVRDLVRVPAAEQRDAFERALAGDRIFPTQPTEVRCPEQSGALAPSLLIALEDVICLLEHLDPESARPHRSLLERAALLLARLLDVTR